MNWITIAAVSFATGIFASLGLGGGMILIIYLTLFAGVPQLQAQGLNLVFFIPIAAVSLYFHTKHKMVEWKKNRPRYYFRNGFCYNIQPYGKLNGQLSS